MTEFKAFPKIPRLNRDCVITEKIDGTNVAVVINEMWLHDVEVFNLACAYVPIRLDDETKELHERMDDTRTPYYEVSAQSRNRMISPTDDNYGFAKWVHENATALAYSLGEGYHYGEWWGQGIQRKYGLDHKRFSLFNVHRWESLPFEQYGLDNVGTVPVLYRGPFDTDTIDAIIGDLILGGSKAAPGFMKPEGVIVWHEAAQQMFKVTCENDEKPKGQS